MPLISRQDSIAANTRSANILDGELFEFVPRPSAISLYVAAAATGIEIDFSVGGETIVQAARAPGTNRFPVRPDDAITAHGALAGERLFLTFNNTTGAAIVVNTLIDVQGV